MFISLFIGIPPAQAEEIQISRERITIRELNANTIIPKYFKILVGIDMLLFIFENSYKNRKEKG